MRLKSSSSSTGGRWPRRALPRQAGREPNGLEFFSETVFLLMISSEFSWYYGATLLHKRVSQIDKDKVTR